MAGTRSLSRLAVQPSPSKSQDDPSPKTPAGAKRKIEATSSPGTKSGKKGRKKKQKTLEETISQPNEETGKSTTSSPERNGKSMTEPEQGDKQSSTQSPKDKSETKPEDRENETPSSILEKGIIYFLFRGRVGIDHPEEINDVARSYMIMRPLPHGSKIGEGPIGDDGNCRLLVLPKKVLPQSGKDRFMVFVEMAKTTLKNIKEKVLSSSEYETKTLGTRHSPATTPIAEGVYAITTTGHDSHLAYIITIPSKLGEVQKDVGLRERGSFNTSVKNPKYPGPANASLPQGPEYPEEILDEFRSLRWMPLQPKLLEYSHTQFLLIGESSGLASATEPQSQDEEKGKNTPLEEINTLEGEDEIRVRHMKGDDTIFADLGLSLNEYPELPSTWEK